VRSHDVWRVGQLARQTGLTVRTLHYYDQIGLLSPSQRSEAGYRLYDGADVVRLQQIRSLRQLGFSLDEIRDCLTRPDFAPPRVIRLHIARLQEQIAQERGLCGLLESIAARLDAADDASAGLLLDMMEAIHTMETYYTPEQLAQLKARGEMLGQERIRQVEAEWPQLIAEMRAEMQAGTDPASEHVQALARRWQGLVLEFTGGDPGITQSLGKMYQNEPAVRQQSGLDMELFAYVDKAMKAGK
jgi:MerR family transcriptional regulator, thiopeptide resistance regulator